MTKKHKKNGPIITWIIIVVLIVVIVLVLIRKSNPSTTEPMTSTSSLSTVSNGSSTVAVGPDWKTYTDSTNNYSFKYPPYLNTGKGQNKATNDYDDIDPNNQFIGSFPANYEPGTNLSAATVFAGVKSVDSSTCSDYVYGNDESNNGNIDQPISATGLSFSRVTVSEGAAGHDYSTTRYSIMHNNLCYEIAIVDQSFNDITGYNMDHTTAPVARYDDSIMQTQLAAMVDTFNFTK
jgi:hypothetical protein